MMRILVVTPWVPFPITGADQQDRFQGFLQLRELGHDIHILAKVHAFQDRSAIESLYRDHNIPLTLVPYVPSLPALLLRRLPTVVREPALLDGSALEYIDPAMERSVDAAIDAVRPDVAWVEYSFLWPMVQRLKQRGIPVVLRSANNEAQQSIDEHRGSMARRVLAVPKFRGERLAARTSDVVLAITPWEEEWYRLCGASVVDVLPLRGLPLTLRRRVHREKDVLDVVFLTCTYNNGHNRDALAFLLQKVIPEVRRRSPGHMRFHITGKKFPDAFRPLLGGDVAFHGFVENLNAFLDTMDVALCPSVTGQGMQQKIFEPLCCGLPLLTHHTAGYPFEHGVHLLLEKDASAYAEGLESFRSTRRRQAFADAAYDLASRLFSKEHLLSITDQALNIARTASLHP